MKEAFYQARKKVGDINHTLPEGAIGPFFNDEFGDTYISLYAVTGQGYSYPELKDYAKRARDILCACPASPRSTCWGPRTSGCSSRSPRRLSPSAG